MAVSFFELINDCCAFAFVAKSKLAKRAASKTVVLKIVFIVSEDLFGQNSELLEENACKKSVIYQAGADLIKLVGVWPVNSLNSLLKWG